MRKNLFLPLYLVLTILFLIRLVPLLMPGARLWGLNHLMFLPSGFTIAYILAAIIALGIPFLTEPTAGKKVSAKFHQFLYESTKKYDFRFGFIILAAVAFVFFAASTHFLGDGYTVLSNLASEKGTFYKWSEKSITVLLSGIQALLGGRNEQTALYSFRTISVISGIVSTWFFFQIAGILAEDHFKRLLIFISSFFSAVLLLFFGYVENYPLLWPALTGLIFFGFNYIKNGRGLAFCGLFLIFGMLVHLQFAFMIPAMIFLLLCRGKGKNLYRQFRIYIWSLLILGLVAFIAIFFYKYNRDLYFENIFLPLLRGKPIAPEYSLLSSPHLADIFNQLILLSPAIILLLAASFGNLKKMFRLDISIFLVLISGAGLLFLFAIDPKLGMPRDWDLFSLAAFAPTLLFIYLIDKKHIESLSRLLISITIYLIAALIPYLATNLNATRSISYFKYMIDLDKGKSMSSLITLRGYYGDINDKISGDSINNIIQVWFPDESKMQEAFSAMRRRDLNRARSIAAAIKPDKFSANYHNFMSTLHMSSGEYQKALEESDKLIQLQKYNYKYYLTRTYIFSALRQPGEAIESVRQAYKYNNTSPEVVEMVSNVFLNSARPDSAYYYAERLIQLDSANVAGYYLLAKINMQLGRLTQARDNAAIYLSRGTRDPLYNARSAELQQLIQNK